MIDEIFQTEFVGLAVFVLTVVFSFGIFYGRMRELRDEVAQIQQKIDIIYTDLSETKERLVRVEALIEKYSEHYKEKRQ